VRTAAVSYWTSDARGKPVKASGLLAVPVGRDDGLDIVVFHHGTTVEKREAPSTPTYLTTQLLAPLFASCGFVFVAPDYVGLGADAPGRHAYLHAASEVTASLDMLHAAREASMGEFGVRWSSRLFLTGFSQGGQATMALQRDLEAADEPAFEVVASAPVAGPYNLSSITAPTVFRRPGANTSLYLAYLLTAYQEFYGIYESAAEAFLPPYDRIVDELFDGLHSSDEVHATLPAAPDELIRSDWWQAATGDGAHAFFRALRENDTDDFAPRAPVRLYVGTADEDVPPENAFAAARTFKLRGSASDVADLGPLDHELTAFTAFPLVRTWFDELAAAT
jgi:pimeloyl-ACP methyl ester carboxylesterase